MRNSREPQRLRGVEGEAEAGQLRTTPSIPFPSMGGDTYNNIYETVPKTHIYHSLHSVAAMARGSGSSACFL